MSEHNPENHLSPFSNVKLLLGDHPIRMVDGRKRRSILKGIEGWDDDLGTEIIVVGVRLSPVREIFSMVVGIAGWKPRFYGGLNFFQKRAAKSGWEVEESVAAFPNLESDRFCFPVSDRDSHRFLINQVLYARRYSLNRRMRTLLNVYRFLLFIFPNPGFLYQSMFVRLRRA